MLITIKQTIDPAILDKEMDDAMGTSRAIMTLKENNYITLRDVIVCGSGEVSKSPGIGWCSIAKIRKWVLAKGLPWSYEGVSHTLLSVRSKTANYEVSLVEIEKHAEGVLSQLAEHPEGPSQDWVRIPIIEDNVHQVGTVKISIKMEIEWDQLSK